MRLAPQELRIVAAILRNHVPEYAVWAFGSRVHGRSLKPFSDIDLAIMTETPIVLERLLDLRAAFSESDLPFRVDIVDWASTDQPFRSIIMAGHEILQHGSRRSSNHLNSREDSHALTTGQSGSETSN